MKTISYFAAMSILTVATAAITVIANPVSGVIAASALPDVLLL